MEYTLKAKGKKRTKEDETEHKIELLEWKVKMYQKIIEDTKEEIKRLKERL